MTEQTKGTDKNIQKTSDLETETNRIKEVIVVEGRDDTTAIKRAIDAETIETHGFGIRNETWKLLEKANKEKGIIIFTDPDHAGEEIRERLRQKFPAAKHAFLDRSQATRADDVGIENAQPKDIIEALQKAKAEKENNRNLFTMEDMWEAGLTGVAGASEARRVLGKTLGIGYGNTTAFLRKLNKYGITREEFYEIICRE